MSFSVPRQRLAFSKSYSSMAEQDAVCDDVPVSRGCQIATGSMPKITINGRFLTQKMVGVQRFAGETTKAIDRLLGEREFAALRGNVEVVAPRSAPDFAMINMPLRRCGMLKGYAWEQVEFPFFTRGSLRLNLCLVGPVTIRHQAIVAHDATVRAMPDNFSWKFRTAYEFLVPRLLRSDLVVTVSNFSRQEIGKYYGVDIARIPICYEGANHITAIKADATIIEKLNLRNRRYLLGVGTHSRNKNYEVVMAAFAKAQLGDVALVTTGSSDPRLNPHAFGSDNSNILAAGYVSDSQLRALYENALALVYPSRYEGFGLPPIEAMQCGCPVIISDQPALIEMAGDAALSCGMDDVTGLAKHMIAVHSNPQIRATLKEAGLKRVQQFTWERTARILLNACLGIGTRAA